MKRCGAVVVFKPGVTRIQAARALASIADVLEGFPKKPPLTDQFRLPSKQKIAFETVENRIQEYDDKFGGPAWYIP